jgi:hypothetical protein
VHRLASVGCVTDCPLLGCVTGGKVVRRSERYSCMGLTGPQRPTVPWPVGGSPLVPAEAASTGCQVKCVVAVGMEAFFVSFTWSLEEFCFRPFGSLKPSLASVCCVP